MRKAIEVKLKARPLKGERERDRERETGKEREREREKKKNRVWGLEFKVGKTKGGYVGSPCKWTTAFS